MKVKNNKNKMNQLGIQNHLNNNKIMEGIDLKRDDNLVVIDKINKNFSRELTKQQKMAKLSKLKKVTNKILFLSKLTKRGSKE